MTGLVLDASVALAWVLPAEARREEAAALAARVAEEGAVVPALWRLEVGNALLMAARRGRIRAPHVDAAWLHLAALPITVDTETSAHAWGATAALARTHGLTLYDAAYLELAARRKLPLATFDAVLERAAGVEGVELVG